MDRITTSWLYNQVDGKFENKRTPKIAIIDTGSDGTAKFIDGRLRNRLNMQRTAQAPTDRWNDFVGCSTSPIDNDRHGSAILSIIYRLAPFADFCVARIAEYDNDLRARPGRTSENLAEVRLQLRKLNKR